MRRYLLIGYLFLTAAVLLIATLNLAFNRIPSASARKSDTADRSSNPKITRDHRPGVFVWKTREGKRMRCRCCKFGCKRKRLYDGEVARKVSKNNAKEKKNNHFCRTPSKATAGQCPCFKEKGRRYCVAYDPAYLAVTIEEAIFNFIDTTNPNPDQAITLKPDPNAVSKKKLKLCPGRDMQCKKCVKYLFDKFLGAAMDISDEELRNSTLDELSDMLYDADVPSYMKGECSRLDVGEIRVPPPSPPDPLGIAECIRGPKTNSPHGLVPDRTSRHRRNAPQDIRDKFPGLSVQPRSYNRHKRPSISEDIELVMDIICIKRGALVMNGSNYIGLCNVCWSFGQLRADLHPRYINLMTCDEDRRCLSGWGECQQRYRGYKVMEKTTENEYESYILNAPLMCDCQVTHGSALHAWVQK